MRPFQNDSEVSEGWKGDKGTRIGETTGYSVSEVNTEDRFTFVN